MITTRTYAGKGVWRLGMGVYPRVCARECGLAGWRTVEHRSTIGRLHGGGSLSDVLVRLCVTVAGKY